VTKNNQNKSEKLVDENLLIKERDRSRMYLDVAGVMIVVLNAQGRVTLLNKRGCEILGYGEEDVIGKDWFENFLPEHVRGNVRTAFNQLMAGQLDVVKYYENPVLTKRGEERIIAWYNALLHDDNGAITGTLSSGEDITLRKKIEQELKDRIEELESFYEMSIERELKMKQLKEEITRLKSEARET
jgi:PAS domain S-box-containing protein